MCNININIDSLNSKLDQIETNFRNGIVAGFNSGDYEHMFDNLAYAIQYTEALFMINNDISSARLEIEACINKYKALSDNNPPILSTETSITRYSDGSEVSKQIIITRWQIIFGLILQCLAFFYIYSNKK